MKKIFCVAVILSMILLIIAGCGGVSLTPEEYRGALTECFRDWSGSVAGISSALFVDENASDKIPPLADKASAALDSIAALVPPEELRQQHEKLRSAMEAEREWLAAVRRFVKNRSADDLDDIEYYANTSDFPATVLETVKLSKAAAGE